MKKGINVLRTSVLAAVITVSFFATTTFAASTLYEQKTVENVVKGVTYEMKHRLTNEGWLDLYILNIDLSNNNLSVEPAQSKTETGLRETVGKILTANGSLAGVNGAYFGMTGNYSASFGPTISNGKILSIDTDKNLKGDQFGTYYKDVNGNSSFDYFRTTIRVVADGDSPFEFSGMNTITKMIYPVCLTSQAGKNTAFLDARFPDLAKVVVTEGKVTKVSAKGEQVDIPENGYVIVLSSAYADSFLYRFYPGQSVELKFTSVVDVEKIKTAITGGGIILKNGEKPGWCGEMAAGRQPRTLLGISQDQKTMKIIVADGKRSGGTNLSIGLNVDESIELLKAEGMYNGLNLDGGGSSVMAVKTADESSISTVSNPAEGSERPVMTAVGVFDNSPIGEIKELVIKPSQERVIRGSSISFEVFGYDENLHKIAVAMENVSLNCDEEFGTISGNTYTPIKVGPNFITATYNDIVATTPINVVDITEISPNENQINLTVGESKSISVKGVTNDGYTVDLSGKATLSSDFGTISGSTFTATQNGGGYIECTYGNLTCYVKIVVGTEEKATSSFEDIKYLNFSAFPKDLTGVAGVSKATVKDGAAALALSYYFKESTATQAAYLELVSPVKIAGEPKGLKLAIKGNGAGQWVRGKITDATGTETVIEFSKDVNWTDWQDVTANIPNTVTYPIALTTIYVAALSNTNTNQQVMYFDNLRSELPLATAVEVPEAVRGNDSLESSTAGKEAGYTYINFGGSVTSKTAEQNAYTTARAAVNDALGKDSDIAVFGGSTDISTANNAEVIKWKEDYAVYNKNNVTLINMFAKNGGLKNTKASQWYNFKTDAKSGTNKNVIIFIDRAPSAFSDSAEGDLFQSALKEVVATGKNVFVLSANQGTYALAVREGVRYIALPNLWKNNGELNKEYKVVRFKINETDLKFEAVDVF